MNETKLKFGITCATVDKGMWSLCVGLSHAWEETYLYINCSKLALVLGGLIIERSDRKLYCIKAYR